MTPYYEDDFVTLYLGDCTDLLPQMPQVDLIFTSPPYNLGVTTGGGFGPNGKWTGGDLAHGYTDHDDAMPLEQYEDWQREVLRLCWAQLTDIGAIFYNHKPRVQDRTLWLPLRLNPDLPVRQIITWARAGGMNYAPTHYVPTYEWIVVFARYEWRLRSKGASGIGDCWRVPQETSKHPAPFPLALPAMAIESAGPSTVMDPFSGSGTTLLAAKRAGIRAVGIEKSERYCEMAAERLGGAPKFAEDSLFGESA